VSWFNKLSILGLWKGGTPAPVSDTDKMPVSDSAAQTTLAAISNKDFATQATLALVLAKLDVALSTRASDAVLAQCLTKLGDIFGAVDGLELTAQNIELNGAEVGLNTDEVESLLRTLRDNLGLTTDAEATGDGSLSGVVKRLRTLLAGGLPASLGQKANAASLPTVLSTEQEAILAAVRDRLPAAFGDGRLKTDAHVLARYKITDEAAGATAYYGFLANNGDWYIMREVAATGEYRYANLSNNATITGGYSGAGADKAWVNRATLTYGYFNTLTGL
jgi:hypothetical protein